MKCFITLLALTIFTSVQLRAQYLFTGKIEYERKMNVHAQMEEMEENEWFQQIKSKLPKFSSSYFELSFDSLKSMYKPGRETENPFRMFGGGPATDNIVYTDFVASKVKAQKTIYEQKFLVQDSMRHLDWKEKDEIRTIAGYQCHKAVSRICDSVYVVAFYTEDIPVSGGPEMFGGLPGMILELAVPRLHTTWVATKVEQNPIAETEYKAPEKGKKVTQSELITTVQQSFKDWGNMASRNIWWTVL